MRYCISRNRKNKNIFILICYAHTCTYYYYYFLVLSPLGITCQSSLNAEKSLNLFCTAIIAGSLSKKSKQSSILSLLSNALVTPRGSSGVTFRPSRFWMGPLFIVMTRLSIPSPLFSYVLSKSVLK